MGLPGVFVQRSDGGLGRKAPSQDGISGIIIGIPAAYGIATGNFKFGSLAEAEAAGFTDALDRTHHVMAWWHLSEFFRFSSSELHVRAVVQPAIGGGVAGPISYADMLSPAGTHAPSLVAASNGSIRQIGVAMNPDFTTYVPSVAGGLDSLVAAGIVQGQALAVSMDTAGKPLLVVMEGRGFNGVASGLTNLRTAGTSDRVCIALGLDPERQLLDAAFIPCGNTGTVLGLIAGSQVHVNIGWVAVNNIQDSAAGRYPDAMLPGGHLVSSFSILEQGLIHDKGYIFPRQFTGSAGVFVNDDPTGGLANSDFSQVRYCRAADKAKREVIVALTPLVNQPVYLQADGTLQKGDVASMEATASKPLDDMQSAGEVSNFDVYIDPAQAVLSTNTVNIRIAVQPVGCSSRIESAISFTTTIE